jgi:hypothetical protein
MRERVEDHEIVYRLVHPNLWLPAQHRPMSSLFRGDEISVFVASRLPGPVDDVLHVGTFAAAGRVALSVAVVRTASPELTLDVVWDPDGAIPPFAHLGPSHAVITGANSARAARILVELVAVRPESMERVPQLIT